MKGYVGDIRFHPHHSIEVDDELDLFHIVADWPNAKCGADLTGREHRQQSIIEVANEGKPLCAKCLAAEWREQDVKLDELEPG